MNDQSFYFQTIARKFFDHRGTPFFLSSNELSLIEKWEASNIPLRVVLEGLNKAFSVRKHDYRRRQRKKIRSLYYCEPYVNEAYSLYKERKVGGKHTLSVKTDKKKQIHTAVVQFLNEIPRQIEWLEEPFKHVKKILSDCSEEALEKAEEDIEALLVVHASQEDRAAAHKEAAAAFPDVEEEDLKRILHITLIKFMRGKYKIPHVVPFLY